MEQTDEKKTHELKTVQPYFNQLLRGEKTFELRFNDRGFKVGDKLALKEYTIPDHDFMGGDEYSGRFIEAEIIGMLENYKGVEPGYCILSLATTAKQSIIDGQKERIEELEKQIRLAIQYYEKAPKYSSATDMYKILKNER